MKRIALTSALIAAFASAIAADALHGAESTPQVGIVALTGGNWRVSYRSDHPAHELVFARSTDDSRSKHWIAPRDFEIVATSRGEIVRRSDGKAFSEVSLAVPPVYSVLPKDYAPFSPFGDGGILFHSGRFFACAGDCPHDASWSMQLQAAERTAILLNGERSAGEVSWRDGGDGRVVYIGHAQPVETADFVAVIDSTLPPAISAQLTKQLPPLMRHNAARLGALAAKPMLFVSYDTSHADRWGRQGGTLPGQVFIHFYGNRWTDEMGKPDFAGDLAWHFAHEAAHMYQRNIFADGEDAWIHEGAAEAFAALALRSADKATQSFVESRIASAARRCSDTLADRTIVQAIGAGDFDAAYTCGLIVNLGIDSELRRIAPDTDGLYGLWREYIRRAEGHTGDREADYLASLIDVGGAQLAAAIRQAVHTAHPDLSAPRH